MTTYQDLIKHLHNIQENKYNFGLDRILKAAELLGNPQNAIPCVHIAGTNGKGSTLAFIRELLMNAGLRVGAYTSPHLLDYAERISIDAIPMTRDELAKSAETIFTLAGKTELSYFEFTTLLAFQCFARSKANIVLYEVGLGGRLDATNIVHPLVSVITSVSVDHVEYLGHTLSQIALEKCGIIKPNVPVVSAPQDYEVEKIIINVAEENESEVIFVSPVENSVKLGLAGKHQRINAGIAIEVVKQLNKAVDISVLSNVRWPARNELIRQHPPVLFDAAHNLGGAKSLKEYLKSIKENQKITLIFGAMKDKEIQPMLVELMQVCDKLIIVQIDNERAATIEEIKNIAELVAGRSKTIITTACWEDVEKVIQQQTNDEMIVGTGSLFMYEGMRACCDINL